MVGADLVRCATLVPVALAGLSGSLPLWSLIVSVLLFMRHQAPAAAAAAATG